MAYRTFSTPAAASRLGGSGDLGGQAAADLPPDPAWGYLAPQEVGGRRSGLGGTSTSGGSGGAEGTGGPEEDFNFVQVGRPIRARIPPGSKWAKSGGGTGTGTGGGGGRVVSPSPLGGARAVVAASAVDSGDSAQMMAAAEEAAEGPLERIPMLPPHQRQQRPLPSRVVHEMWRTAEELAGGGQLTRLAVGRGGLNRGLLAQAGRLLEQHELIRVYLLPNCDLEIGFVSWVLENALDCVALKVKGRTVTVYRESGLPRPPASFREEEEDARSQAQAQAQAQSQSQSQSQAQAQASAHSQPYFQPQPHARSRSPTRAEQQQSGTRIGAAAQPQPQGAVAGVGGEGAARGAGEDSEPEANDSEAAAEAVAAGTGGGSKATSFATRFRRAWALRGGRQMRLALGRER